MCRYKMRLSQSGQALLEYILLILISMTLILGVVWKFNFALHTYMTQIFSPDEGYLACLIKNGVLPGDDICQSNFPKFNYAAAPEKKLGGDALTTERNNSVGNNLPPPYSSTPVSDSQAAGKNSSSTPTRGSGDRGSTLIATNSGDIKGASSFGGSSNSGNASSKSSTNSGKEKKSGSKGFESSEGDGGGGSSENSGSYFSGGPSRYVSAEKSLGSRSEKAQTIPTNDHDLKTRREIAAEKLKKKSLLENESEFSFSGFVKWIIIISLILLIIFFVGSQLVAVSKGNKRQ
jgi:hypothetical protein